MQSYGLVDSALTLDSTLQTSYTASNELHAERIKAEAAATKDAALVLEANQLNSTRLDHSQHKEGVGARIQRSTHDRSPMIQYYEIERAKEGVASLEAELGSVRAFAETTSAVSHSYSDDNAPSDTKSCTSWQVFQQQQTRSDWMEPVHEVSATESPRPYKQITEGDGGLHIQFWPLQTELQ